MSELQLIPAMVATSASALLGRSVLGPDGKVCGQVKDLAVDVSKDQAHVAALLAPRAAAGPGGSRRTWRAAGNPHRSRSATVLAQSAEIAADRANRPTSGPPAHSEDKENRGPHTPRRGP